MFSCSFKFTVNRCAHNSFTFIKKSQRYYKVVVTGATGGVGQPLALLLKMNPLVTKLALFDVTASTPGISEDVAHIDSLAKVTCHVGSNEVVAAIKGADVVIHAASVSRKSGPSAFDINARIARDLAIYTAQNAPKAMSVIISSPINSLVPIVSEVMKKADVYDAGRIFGVTTLDVIRASVFVAETFDLDPRTVSVPVIGGGSTNTIIPVFSQCKPPIDFRDQEQIKALTIRVREAGDKMAISKAGTGLATLSLAYATARLVDSILRGIKGQPDIIECAYVRSDVADLKYFSNPVLLGQNGICWNLGYGKLSEFEQKLLEDAVPELRQDIERGEKFIETEKMQLFY
ncbi:unnamed protein product [Chilo suppressalis]|uniref:Malate dehydrogenase n=1 Tax=Chilo suppressalis TaxID=168631 RepID=A0ABN8B1Q9_CHISP|nr:hypothetical protein evm_007407 [Chilo suppressalis]CAH0402891.1 unnamed protein product [Chilo suppressalis]